MEIENIAVEKLIPYEFNNKVHDETQVNRIANSIKEFWFLQPIVIDKDNVIIVGHGRLEWAKKLWLKEVPCVRAENLTETQIKKYRILDNKLNESERDIDNLKLDLEDLWDLDIWDIKLDISDVFPDLKLDDEEETEIEEDEAPEVSQEAKIVMEGDLFQLWNHRLLCGDATKIEDTELLMDGKLADMVFTDPPYWINLDTDYSNISGGWSGQISYAKSKKYNKVIGDSEHYDIEHLFRDFGYCNEIFLWGANYFADKLPDLEKSSWIVWDKTGYHQQQTVGSEFELLWSKSKHRQIIISYKWAGVIGLSQQDLKSRKHPTQKPLQVLTPILEKYSKSNEIVLDLFGWSWSTLIACEQLNRKCYMMELDPKYIEVIIKRYHNLSPNAEIKCLNRDIDIKDILQ